MTGVNFNEALAVLLGFTGPVLQRPLPKSSDSSQHRRAEDARSRLNLDMESCSLEDQLLIRAAILSEDYLWVRSDESSWDTDKWIIDDSVDESIKGIEAMLARLPSLEAALREERSKPFSTIRPAPSAVGTQRYDLSSVLAWGAEQLNLEPADTLLLTTHDIFNRPLPPGTDKHRLKKLAMFETMSCLLNRLLDEADQLELSLQNGPRPSVKAIRDIVAGTLKRLDAGDRKYPIHNDAYYRRIQEWSRYYQSGCVSDRPKLSDTEARKLPDIIVAILIILDDGEWLKAIRSQTDLTIPALPTPWVIHDLNPTILNSATFTEVVLRSLRQVLATRSGLDETAYSILF